MLGYGQTMDVNLLKAKACLDQNRVDSALSLLTMSVNSFQKAQMKGDCYYKKKAYPTAIRFYQMADSLTPGSCCYGLSRAYAGMGDQVKAAAWIRKYLSSPTKKSELEIAKDTAFQTVSKTKEWRQVWQNEWYSASETERNAILALLSKGRISEAQTELEGNEGKFSPRYEYFYLQAKVYEKQHLLEPAITSMEKAVTFNSFSDEYYLFYANLLKDNKKFNDALESITKAIRINPYHPAYYLKRGEIARLANNYVLSEKDLKLYKELYPANVETYHQLGLLETARGNYQNSMDYYDVLLAKDKAHAPYFMERGNLALTLNQVQKADEDFSLALDLNPNLTDAYLKKGNTLHILNDPSGACFYWSKALELGSTEAAKLKKENCKE